MISTVVRRSLEMAHDAISKTASEHDEIEIPAGAAFVFALTILVFAGLFFAISYTYGDVIPTLCMVEEEQTNAYVAVNNLSSSTDAESSAPPPYTLTADDSPKKSNSSPTDIPELEAESVQEREPEVLLVRSKAITNSLRATILHLRARAGYWSRFRGLSMFLVWSVTRGILVSGLVSMPFLHHRFGLAVSTVIAELILARAHMAWIHIIISLPSTKRWYQRIPKLSDWPKIAPAVFVHATVSQIVSGFPMLVCQTFGPMKHLHDPAFEPGKKDLYSIFGQSLMVIFLMLALFILLEIPATVTLVRVAASMLPDEDETIVPFDRTFGNKVQPAILGGSGKIGMLDAWRSFNWAGRKRLLKLIAKVFVIMFSLWLLFSFVIIAEAPLVLGDNLGNVMKKVHGHVDGWHHRGGHGHHMF